MPVLGSNYAVPPVGAMHSHTGSAPVDAGTGVVVDGTPVRVVMLAFAGAAGLFALKLAGIKFSVGVSS